MANPQLLVTVGAKLDALEKGMQDAQKHVKNASKGIQGSLDGIKSKMDLVFGAAAIGAAVAGLAKLNSAFNQLINAGETAGSIRDAFEKLGGTSASIDAAKKATVGLVDSFDLMKAANAGLVAGIPKFNENFGKIADIGARLADTLGIDTKDAINQVTQALEAGKVKGLANIGVIVDEKKAYDDFAKSIGTTAESLSALGKRAAIQEAAMGSLDDALLRLGPIMDSVANAQEAFANALGEAYKEIGIAVNSSEELAQVWRELEKVVKAIDWAEVGKGVANLALVFTEVLIPAISKTFSALEWLTDPAGLKRGLDVISQITSGAVSTLPQAIETMNELARLEDEAAARAQKSQPKGLGESKLVFSSDLFKGQLDTSIISKAFDDVAKKAEGIGEATRRSYIDASAAQKEAAGEAKRAAKEIEGIKTAWEKTVDSIGKKDLGERIKDSIDRVDSSAFDSLISELRQNVESAFIEGNKDALKAGIPEAEIRSAAIKSAQIEVDAQTKAFADAQLKQSADLQKQHEDAYKQSIDFWSTTFRDAISGNSQDFKQIFEDLFVGLASTLAASISDGLTESVTGKGAQGLGELLGQQIVGGMNGGSSGSGGGLFSGLGSLFGLGGMSAADAQAAGIQGPANAAGQFQTGTEGASTAAGFAAAISTITSAFSARERDRANNDNSGTGTAAGGAIGAGVGSLGGPTGILIGQQVGSALGGFIGSLFPTGSQNPQTQARHAFANFIEESFDKLSTIVFQDAKGNFKLQDAQQFNFVEGDRSRFNSPDWVQQMAGWGEDAKKTFLGLGEALKLTLGLTEDVGSQIGFLLGENLSGNIDNARLLVYQLGLSFQDLEDALVSNGLSGAQSWHQVEVALQGVSEAFKPGIAAVGDLSGAVDALAGSGGRGSAAIKAVKDIAVEALEAGAKSITDLPALLSQQGVAQETINAIIGAIKQRGIKTLEELAAVSDRVGGGIVADIESSSKTFAESWRLAGENIKNITDQLAEIPAQLESTIKIRSELDNGAKSFLDSIENGTLAASASVKATTTAFANGGVISSRTSFGRGIAGEAGPEAILPLKSLPNGRLGVSAIGTGGRGGNTLVINAQGAGPGVEHAIRAEIEAMGDIAVARAINAVQDMAGRGGRNNDY